MRFPHLALFAIGLQAHKCLAEFRPDLSGNVQIAQLDPGEKLPHGVSHIPMRVPGSDFVAEFHCAIPDKQFCLNGPFVACCFSGQHLSGSETTFFDCCGPGHDVSGSPATGYACCLTGWNYDGHKCYPPIIGGQHPIYPHGGQGQDQHQGQHQNQNQDQHGNIYPGEHGQHQGQHQDQHQDQHQGEHQGQYPGGRGQYQGQYPGGHGQHQGQNQDQHQGQHQGEHQGQYPDGHQGQHQGQNQDQHQGQHQGQGQGPVGGGQCHGPGSCNGICPYGKQLVDSRCQCPTGEVEGPDGKCHRYHCSSGIVTGKCYQIKMKNGLLGLEVVQGAAPYYGPAPDSRNHRAGIFQFCKDQACTPGLPVNPSDAVHIKDRAGDPNTGHNPGQWLDDAHDGGHIGKTPNYNSAGNFTITKWPCGKYCLGGKNAGIGPTCPADVVGSTFLPADKGACVEIELIEIPCDNHSNANNCIWKNGNDQCCDKVDCSKQAQKAKWAATHH